MAAQTPVCDFGWQAPDFDLPLVDGSGRRVRLAEVRGPKGLLVMFICNHCPYVQAIAARLAEDARAMQGLGIGVLAISSNDAAAYPDDAPAALHAQALRCGFSFPYAYDEDQSVARAYGAVCTPDFFGFDAQGGLQYRGRFDASRKEQAPPGTRRDLLEAMRQIAETGRGPAEQIPSIGCSIKWK
jgi:peroxiredoxin